ncbi:Adapter protein MecA 2 [compost metagenome]
MKIEKLTENKIRIILNLDDLSAKNIDIQSLMTNSDESQSFMIDILNEAEKEVGFVTNDCRIMIEALGSSDGHFVFTITKFLPDSEKEFKRKKLNVKRKSSNLNFDTAVYSFASFDEFCEFCVFLDGSSKNYLSKVAKNTSLYLYNDTYYLSLTDINKDFINLNSFYAVISEFAKLVNNSDKFESKLIEHGKCIIKRNAIKTGIKFFVK